MVTGPDEFYARPVAGQQRTVEVSAGVGVICGVQVTETTDRTLALEANTSGVSRYDLIVLKAEWLGAGSSRVTLEVRKGAASPPVPVRNPGVVYEAVVAVVQVAPNTGQLTGSMIYQLTPYGGKGGPIYVAQSQWIGPPFPP